MLEAMIGVDALDSVTSESNGKAFDDYAQFLKLDGLEGARLGVARNFFGHNPHVDRILENCLIALKEQGAELIDPANLENLSQIDEPELTVLYYDFKADLDAYLSHLGPAARVHSLADVIDFNERHRERVMPYFGQEHMLKAQKKGPLTDEAYLKDLETARRLARVEGIDSLIQAHKLDAIVAPTGGPAWLIDYVLGDTGNGGCSSPAAVAGYPHVTVPAGFVYGLPVGLSFFGAAWSEPILIRLAYAFEQATHFRQPPQFLPSVRYPI